MEGEPVAKSRPKVEIRYKNGRPYPHVYTPDTTAQAEIDLGWAFKNANTGWEPLTGPIRIKMLFVTNLAKGGDWDNYAKTVCDALNGIAWLDDSQILEAEVTIRRGSGWFPQTSVWIFESRSLEDLFNEKADS
jgi:Holliday junction resolvase RusA-like endonuclease